MPHSCPTRRSSDLGDEFETAISRDDRRPAVDPRGAAADDALLAAIADVDADRRSFGELAVGAAAQPSRAHGDLGTVCPLVPRAARCSHAATSRGDGQNDASVKGVTFGVDFDVY